MDGGRPLLQTGNQLNLKDPTLAPGYSALRPSTPGTYNIANIRVLQNYYFITADN